MQRKVPDSFKATRVKLLRPAPGRSSAFRVVVSLSCLAAFSSVSPARAENAFHHIHLNVTDAKAAAAWYAEHFGGAAERYDYFNATRFGEVLLVFETRPQGFPGSVGSGVDHIGFATPDLNAKLTRLADAGARITQPARTTGPLTTAFLEDPWGLSIKIVEDAEVEGLTEVHLYSAEPEAAIQWYEDLFGGERHPVSPTGPNPALRFGQIWVAFQEIPTPWELEPTAGRALDHLCWRTDTFDDLLAKATEPGAPEEEENKTVLGPIRRPKLNQFFLEGPDKVTIEVVELR